jgi:hypothetical protein
MNRKYVPETGHHFPGFLLYVCIDYVFHIGRCYTDIYIYELCTSCVASLKSAFLCSDLMQVARCIILDNVCCNTVKLVQSGIARDRIYFPHWPSFCITQNCKIILKSIKIILHGTNLFMSENQRC